MPNPCMNRLVITGNAELIKAFVEQAKGEKEALDLNSFLPMPAEIRNASAPIQDEELAKKLVVKYGHSTQRGWAQENWGTKLDCYAVDVEVTEEDRIKYEFCTAWSPFADNVLIAMSAAHPILHFELIYAESGNDFWGRRTAQGGRLLLNDGGSLEEFAEMTQSVRRLAGLDSTMKFSRCPDDLSLTMFYQEFIQDTSQATWSDPESWETEFVQWLMVHIRVGLLPYQEEALPVIRGAYQEALWLLGYS